MRLAYEDEPYQRHARRKMKELSGSTLGVDEFYQLGEDRYEPYRKCAVGECKESNDLELWTKWLLPDHDLKQITCVCHELSLQYRLPKGRREVVEQGAEVLAA